MTTEEDVLRVIETCITEEQLESAQQYAELWCAKNAVKSPLDGDGELAAALIVKRRQLRQALKQAEEGTAP